MKLKDCTIGKVVCIRDNEVGEHYGKPQVSVRRGDERLMEGDTCYTLIGHVVGLDLNCFGETIVTVLWNDKKKYSVHPNQLMECEE